MSFVKVSGWTVDSRISVGVTGSNDVVDSDDVVDSVWDRFAGWHEKKSVSLRFILHETHSAETYLKIYLFFYIYTNYVLKRDIVIYVQKVKLLF